MTATVFFTPPKKVTSSNYDRNSTQDLYLFILV